MKKQKESPFHFDVIEENTGFLFWQVSHTWQTTQNKILKRNFGVSQLQYVILSSTYWLNMHKVEVTQTYLAHHTKVEKMTISKNIDMLESMGYLTKTQHSSNGRTNLIAISDKGIEMLLRAIKYIEAFDEDFFKSLGKNIKKMNLALTELIEGNRYFY
jgi:DNA-binding MarR family transcriptional regulator